MKDAAFRLGVLVFGVALAPNPQSAHAQDDEIEEIVVTGSRIARRDMTAPSPITTLDRTDLATAPQPTLEETLNQMPQLVPDMGRTRNNGSNGEARLNLRGLGSQRTLVLLNGRRQSPSGRGSSVDINNIPQILVERVEIITGGASTVYGSDALAGVVNFITRDDFEGFNVELNYGVTQEGDGGYTGIDMAWGSDFAGGRGNVTVYGSYYDRESVFGRDRELTSEVINESHETGEIVVGGSFGIPSTSWFFPEIDWGIDPLYPYTTFNPDGVPRGFVHPDDLYNWQEVNYVQTPLERKSAGIIGSFAIGEHELYLETAYTNNQTRQELAPPVLFDLVAVNYDNPVLTPEASQLITDNSVPLGPGVGGIFIGNRLEGAGPRQWAQNKDYWRTVLGFKGELGAGWEFDAWVTYTKSSEEEGNFNATSYERFTQGLLVDPSGQCFDPSNGCVPVDIFGRGRISEDAGNFLRYEPLYNVTSREQQLASVFVTGSPFDTWAGPLDIAFGADWRSDDVSFKSDDALAVGDVIGFSWQTPVEGKESVTEGYLEAIVPLLSDLPGAQYMGLELGARYSKYNSAGGVWTYKAGAMWDPTQSVRFRAMWQKSVRAPNNEELFTEQFTGDTWFSDPTDSDPCSASQDPVGNGFADRCVIQGLPADQVGVFEAADFYPAVFFEGGNTELVPEEANTYTVGVTWSPEFLPSWNFAVDYYRMDVEREIGEISARNVCFDLQNTEGVFCDKLSRDGTGNVVEIDDRVENRGVLSTTGVDTQINYSTDLPESLSIFGGAQFAIQLVWTHMLEYQQQENPATANISCEGYFGSPCAPWAGVLAENRVITNFNYFDGPLGLTLSSRWISGSDSWYQVDHLYFGGPPAQLAVPTIGSQYYLNLNASYQFTDNIYAGLNIANLLDKDAPLIPVTYANNTDSGLYDIFGRAFSLNVGMHFGN